MGSKGQKPQSEGSLYNYDSKSRTINLKIKFLYKANECHKQSHKTNEILGGGIFVFHITEKRLISFTYKELLEIGKKKPNNPIEKKKANSPQKHK